MTKPDFSSTPPLLLLPVERKGKAWPMEQQRKLKLFYPPPSAPSRPPPPLPDDILEIIFDYLAIRSDDDEDEEGMLYSCALVCRRYLHWARSHLYQAIELCRAEDHDNLDKMNWLSNLDNPPIRCLIHPHLAQHVRHIHFPKVKMEWPEAVETSMEAPLTTTKLWDALAAAPRLDSISIEIGTWMSSPSNAATLATLFRSISIREFSINFDTPKKWQHDISLEPLLRRLKPSLATLTTLSLKLPPFAQGSKLFTDIEPLPSRIQSLTLEFGEEYPHEITQEVFDKLANGDRAHTLVHFHLTSSLMGYIAVPTHSVLISFHWTIIEPTLPSTLEFTVKGVPIPILCALRFVTVREYHISFIRSSIRDIAQQPERTTIRRILNFYQSGHSVALVPMSAKIVVAPLPRVDCGALLFSRKLWPALEDVRFGTKTSAFVWTPWVQVELIKCAREVGVKIHFDVS